MSYDIKRTDGQTLVVIEDGLTDTTHSSLTLFGKNSPGYGPLLNEDLVKLLENFAYSSSPQNPLQGQLWWDTVNGQLLVRKDQNWKIISGPTPSSIAPSLASQGDLWWDTANKQLNAYNGAGWSLVGPSYTASQGLSGAIAEDVGDTSGNKHTVIKLYSNGVVIGVVSKDPTFATTEVTGFLNIKPGINLGDGNNLYYGTSENALKLGGVLAANYLRSDVVSATYNALKVQSNDGLYVGQNDDFLVNVQGTEVALSNLANGRAISIYNKVGGVATLSLQIDATGKVNVFQAPTALTGVVSKGYLDQTMSQAATRYLHADGSVAIAGNLAPTSTNLYSIGSSNATLASVYTNSVVATTLNAGSAIVGSITLGGAPTANLSAATKKYVDDSTSTVTSNATLALNGAISGLVGSAPATLNTLGAIASAIGNNPTYAANMTTLLDAKAPVMSPNFQGTPQAPTVDVNDVSSKIATTSFVSAKVGALLNGNVSLGTASIGSITTGSITATSVSAGSYSVTGAFTTPTSNTIDIGSSTNRFRTVYGTTVSAQYADLAEKYEADADYEAGTVVMFGGEKEVTLCIEAGSTAVAGVVSWNPAYVMNDKLEADHVVTLALQGRCPVKVRGDVKKGDLLVSAGNGAARALSNPKVGTVIGKALENFIGFEGLIEVAIGRC